LHPSCNPRPQGLLDFCNQPGFVRAVFLNLDCRIERANLFETAAGLLSKTAFPVNRPLAAVHLLALDGLLAIMSSLARGCGKKIIICCTALLEHVADGARAQGVGLGLELGLSWSWSWSWSLSWSCASSSAHTHRRARRAGVHQSATQHMPERQLQDALPPALGLCKWNARYFRLVRIRPDALSLHLSRRSTGQIGHEADDAGSDNALVPVWEALCAGRLPPPVANGHLRDADSRAGAHLLGLLFHIF